jgi:hypothetical protein
MKENIGISKNSIHVGKISIISFWKKGMLPNNSFKSVMD